MGASTGSRASTFLEKITVPARISEDSPKSEAQGKKHGARVKAGIVLKADGSHFFALFRVFGG
jgi:hypothetical protein